MCSFSHTQIWPHSHWPARYSLSHRSITSFTFFRPHFLMLNAVVAWQCSHPCHHRGTLAARQQQLLQPLSPTCCSTAFAYG